MRINLKEEQFKRLAIIKEDVYINNLKRKANKNVANLTYSKNSTFNKGNKVSSDMRKTGLMDNQNGSTTYEVPLKGGLMSYNITDINGTEVMHYFKRQFEKRDTKIKIYGEEYYLEIQVALAIDDDMDGDSELLLAPLLH